MDFEFGPFSFSAGGIKTINGQSSRAWNLSYGVEQLAAHHIDAAASRGAVIDAFRSSMADLVERFKRAGWPEAVQLLHATTGVILATIPVPGGVLGGMIPAIPDSSSEYWLTTARSPVRSMRVTLDEFAIIAAHHIASPCEWMQSAMPDAVLALDPAQWRAPTAWELRHVVGEGSFTGITVAKAAELVGVTPQNFRKYLARDGAATRQNMSFAMWHLLLQRLGVQRI